MSDSEAKVHSKNIVGEKKAANGNVLPPKFIKKRDSMPDLHSENNAR